MIELSAGEIGLVVGLVVGTTFGALIMGVLASAGRADAEMNAYEAGRADEARLRAKHEDLMEDGEWSRP